MFMGQLNNVLMFVGEQCVVEEGARSKSDDLFEAYKAWCDKSGLRPLGSPKFQEQLMHKWKIEKVRGCWPEGRRMTYIGIRLMVEDTTATGECSNEQKTID
jgi:phage/plasmid-associated DNA primase